MTLKGLLSCGAVAGPLFTVVVVGQMLTRDGFDIRRQPLSLLSLGDLGWIQIANFMLTGMLFLAFSVGIRRALHPGRAGTWAPVFLAGHGAGLVLAGLFFADPSMGFPPGAPAGVPASLSWHAVMHGVGFMLAFSSLTLASFVFARRFAAFGQWGWVLYCVATGVGSAALATLPGEDARSVSYFVAGLITWAWTTAIAVRLMKESTESTHRAP